MMKCPKCHEELFVEEFYDVGDVLSCDICEEEFIITKMNPIKVKRLPPEYEDELDF